MLYLGIDTSNYTTSTALYDSQTGMITQQKKLLPVREGQLGLRQSDAVFHHTAQLHTLFEQLVSEVDTKQIAAVGVSTRPRPVSGSYMPCFTVGQNTAKILSAALKIPLCEFSHQEGHIAAALYSAGKTGLFDKRFLAFHVSGGTTEAVLANGSGSGFELTLAAKTLDLNAGQAIDRVGLMLGLKFPCGPALEQLALKNSEKPNVRPALKGCDCCLSGVENRCKKLIDEGKSEEYVAAYCLEFVRKTLEKMTDALIEKYGGLPLVYAGGVMSNSIIKNSFTEKYNAAFAEPVFSADNAAGIAYLCYRKLNNVHS
ncbi:MAG: peptidase M22 [Ruminococcus sp.]|nr:peptidase M22 [Ruminococcus sp.]